LEPDWDLRPAFERKARREVKPGEKRKRYLGIDQGFLTDKKAD
jgi:hypothetical protein